MTLTITKDELMTLVQEAITGAISELVTRDEWAKFRETLLSPDDINTRINTRMDNLREEIDKRFIRESNGYTATIDEYRKQIEKETSDIRKTQRTQNDTVLRTIAAQGQNISEISATAVQINANLVSFQKSWDQRLDENKTILNERLDRQRRLIMDNHEQVTNRLQDLETNSMIDHALTFGDLHIKDGPPSLASRMVKVELTVNAMQGIIESRIASGIRDALSHYELGLKHITKQAKRAQWRADLRKKAMATAVTLLTDPKVWFGILSFLGSWIATFLTWWSQHH